MTRPPVLKRSRREVDHTDRILLRISALPKVLICESTILMVSATRPELGRSAPISQVWNA